jgi:hypothetical protein
MLSRGPFPIYLIIMHDDYLEVFDGRLFSASRTTKDNALTCRLPATSS